MSSIKQKIEIMKTEMTTIQFNNNPNLGGVTSINYNNRLEFIHALWITDPSKRATGRNMQPSQRWRKGDVSAVCNNRQQAWADPLLFTKKPATVTCPGVALLVWDHHLTWYAIHPL